MSFQKAQAYAFGTLDEKEYRTTYHLDETDTISLWFARDLL